MEGFRDIEEARVVIIKNTAEMGVKYVSQSLVPEIKDPKSVEVIGEPFELPLDHQGNLTLDFQP